MSPEMITNGSHNHTLDVWCLGILLYELLHGHAPFRGGNYSVIYERIMKGKIRFKKSLPDDARDLIRQILQREANERIPLIKVFAHPWVLRLQKKHNLTKDPSVSNLKKEMEEEKISVSYKENSKEK
jgi:serine/threonine protein kinase